MTRSINKGSVDQSAYVRILNTDGSAKTDAVFNSAGLDLFYRRSGAAIVSITEITQTANGAHADGGFVHIGAGYYRVDPPDAAFAVGADDVFVAGAITGGVIVGEMIKLTDAASGLPLLRGNLVAQSATASTIVLDASASAVDDFYNGSFITAEGQTRQIIDYTGSSKTATIYVAGPPIQGQQWVTTPSGAGLAFAIHGFAIQPLALNYTGGAVQAYVADGALTAAKFGAGFIASTSFAVNAITAASIAADTFTAVKFQDGFLTAAKIATAAITPAKVSAALPANLEQIRAVPLTGNGVSPKFGV
jgi:hypothetical protein